MSLMFDTVEPTVLAKLLGHEQAAPGPPGPVAPSAVGKALEVFDTPLDLYLTFCPELTPYRWQVEMMLALGGYTTAAQRAALARGEKPEKTPFIDNAPLIFNLAAANGSGKDELVLAPFAVWYIICQTNARWIATSASNKQIREQTFKYIVRIAEKINAKLGRNFIEIKDLYLTCRETGSEIIGFVTDEPGRAEGYHPFPGGKMCICLNEAKTVPDEIYESLYRCSGYSMWIEVSSPGDISGKFYENCQRAVVRWPEDIVLAEGYFRKVSAFDCPHLGFQIKRMAAAWGEQHTLYRSNVLAEFTTAVEDVMIPASLLDYPDPAFNPGDGTKRAGVDLSLGGDETVVSVWQGNKRTAQETYITEDETLLISWLIGIFNKYGLKAEHINVDGGGIGKIMTQSLQKRGWFINVVRNDERALDAKLYMNRGAELWDNFRLLCAAQSLILPRSDKTFMAQLSSRKCKITNNGKRQLESKVTMKKNGLHSPDRADAGILAFAGVDTERLLLIKPKAAVTKLPGELNYWDSIKEYGYTSAPTKKRFSYRLARAG